MKNERAPRTLAESSFVTGYSIVQFHKPRSALADVALAVFLGIVGAVALVYGWPL